MKTLRYGFACLAATALTVSLGAQTVQFVLVSWGHDLTQNSASTVADTSANSYQFTSSIQGADGDPLTAGTFSPAPTLGLTTGGVGPALTFRSEDSEYRYQSAWYDSPANLLAAFPASGSSAYTLSLDNAGHTTINETDLPATVTFPTLPDLSTNNLSTPLVTLTGGTWQPNGSYLVNSVGTPVTITFNNIYNTPPTSEAYHYDVEVSGSSPVNLTGGDSTGFINSDPTGGTPLASVPTLTIAAGQLIDGNTYTLEVDYDQILAFGNTLEKPAFMAGLMENRTNITITTPLAAVPEPATCGLLGGLAVLAGVVTLRRKTRAARV